MATREQRLTQFVDWVAGYVTGDEKGEAQIFLDRLFQAFGRRGLPGGRGPDGVPRAQSGRGRRRHRVRRFRLEARRPDRDEAAGDGPCQALPAGVRLLDAPGARPSAVRGAVQLRRVLGLRLRDPDGRAGRSGAAGRACPSATGRWRSSSRPNETPVFGNDHEEVTREAADRLADVLQQADRPQRGPRHRPSDSSCRCSWRCSPRTSACWSGTSSTVCWTTARSPAEATTCSAGCSRR